MSPSLARAVGRVLFSLMFIAAAVNKVLNWNKTVAWTHNTMDGNGFALDRLLGIDDVGMVPLLLGFGCCLEFTGVCALLYSAGSVCYDDDPPSRSRAGERAACEPLCCLAAYQAACCLRLATSA
jgi:hypothetical protein